MSVKRIFRVVGFRLMYFFGTVSFLLTAIVTYVITILHLASLMVLGQKRNPA